MEGSKRRELICEEISSSVQPISASSLAKKFQVSRQVIVQDVALLRAIGKDIYATPRGYMMNEKHHAQQFRIACRHTHAETLQELYTIVDLGGIIKDVIVEHPIYGELCAQLDIHSRYEADQFIAKTNEQEAHLLSSLSDGVHLHTIEAKNDEMIEQIKKALSEKGFLLKHLQ